MAIPIKDKVRYDQLHEELKQHIFPPYADAVREILNAQGIQVSNRKIYNVVKGMVKDFPILYALRKHFNLMNPDEEAHTKSMIKRQKLNIPAS